MIRGTDKDKLEYIGSVIKTYLDNKEATSLFAVLIAFDKVTKGREGIDLHEVAKAVSKAVGQDVDVGSSFKISEDDWKRK